MLFNSSNKVLKQNLICGGAPKKLFNLDKRIFILRQAFSSLESLHFVAHKNIKNSGEKKWKAFRKQKVANDF